MKTKLIYTVRVSSISLCNHACLCNVCVGYCVCRQKPYLTDHDCPTLKCAVRVYPDKFFHFCASVNFEGGYCSLNLLSESL